MTIHRDSLMISILNDDKLTADFVNETFKKWPELKKQAAGYVKRLREIWKKEFVSDAELGYLG